MVHSINQASDFWGIRCLRYEIKDIHVPPRVKESMQMQVRTDTLYKRTPTVDDSPPRNYFGAADWIVFVEQKMSTRESRISAWYLFPGISTCRFVKRHFVSDHPMCRRAKILEHTTDRRYRRRLRGVLLAKGGSAEGKY